MQKRFSQLNKKQLILSIVGILFMIAGFAFIYRAAGSSQDNASIIASREIQEAEAQEQLDNVELFPRLLDGVLVPENDIANFPISVMIENHPEARPQAGLADAQIVFEAPVEGGITRFMAIYSDYADLEKLGPIRSARPYYLDWHEAYDGLYLHVGGSPDALADIKEHGIRNLDQFFKYEYYYRSEKRLAPHNVYTNGELISRAIDDRDLKEKELSWESWNFIDDAGSTIESPDDIEINFSQSSASYNVRWEYDPNTNEYLRFHGSIPHKDETGRQISAKNVVLVYTPIWIIDDVGRRKIKTIGSGDALIFNNGLIQEGQWEKLSRAKQIQFTLADQESGDTEFAPMVRGNTWVEIVSETFDISY